MSRIVSIFIVAFWLVMTILLVREIHFEVEIEVSKVLDTFFESDSPGGEYELLKKGEKTGLISVNTRQRKTEERVYRELVLTNVEDEKPWSASIFLSENSMDLDGIRLRSLKMNMEMEVISKPKEGQPILTVKQGNRVIFSMDSLDSLGSFQSLISMEALGPAYSMMLPILAEGLSSNGKSNSSDSEAVKAYEEYVEIGGRKREVYTIVASFGPDQKITAYFSKLGDLISVKAFDDFELRQLTEFDSPLTEDDSSDPLQSPSPENIQPSP